jgi:hypothetical protein
MGMDRTVTFTEGGLPSWVAIRDLLEERGLPVQLRMIDGELALPDELPPETWRELRVGTPQGMVTLRRQAGQVDLVIWGNADAALRQAWDALTWAVAAAASGHILTAQGSLSAEEFLRTAGLPPGLRRGADR